MKKIPHERQKSENRYDSRNESRKSDLPATLAKAQNDLSDPRQAQPIFISDKKGDFQNLKYGEPDRYKVPRFNVSGRGRLIGLDGRYRFEKPLNLASKRTVHDASLDQGRKDYKNSLLLGSPLKIDEFAISIQPDRDPEHEMSAQKDYLALEPNEKRASAIDGDASSDSETMSDVISQRHSQIKTSKSNDLVGESSLQTYERFLTDSTHQRNLELQRMTKEDSENVEAWLALIDLQEDLFLSRAGGKATLSAKDRKIISEIRISIYETAITKVPNTASKEFLILGLIREGSLAWDLNRQEGRWKRFLTETGSIQLYVKFLDFQQINLLSFSLDSCISQYVAAIHRARQLPLDVTRDELLVYLILRVTSMLWDAGFTERAVGTWQALMELNFFRSPDMPEDVALHLLEQFWNKENLRVGENGARGFGSGTPSAAAPKQDPEMPAIKSSERILDRWAEVEIMVSKISSRPARTLDDTSEDDPYRVVMFSDLRDFMFSIKSERGTDLLLQAFLQFAGLPPLLNASFTICRGWWIDQFLTKYQPITSNDTAGARDSAMEHSPFANCIPDTAVLFKGSNSIFDLTKDNDLLSFAQTLITQLLNLPVGAFDNSSFTCLAEYAVALRVRNDIDRARKLARSLLKKHPENLRLYNAYALIECRVGNFEAGERAWSAALSMSTSNSQTGNHEKGELWRTWVWQCLDREQHGKALRLISMMHNDQIDLADLQEIDLLHSRTSISRIRSENYLESELQQCFHNNLHREAAAFADILAVLAYLSDNREMKRIEQTHESIISRFYRNNTRSHSSYQLELLRQNQARLLHYHTKTSHSYRPRDVIQSLSRFHQAFPGNTILWRLHQYHAQKAGLIDRLRDTVSIDEHNQREMRSDDTDSSRAMTLLLAISSEFNRPSYSGSTAHSIRAAFARAASDGAMSSLSHSLAVWKSWLRWESEQARQVPSHSRESESGFAHSKRSDDSKAASKSASTTKQLLETFYAALRACPWGKDLYLIGLGDEILREALGIEGCKRVYNSMIDRGLRTRLDISEMLDELSA